MLAFPSTLISFSWLHVSQSVRLGYCLLIIHVAHGILSITVTNITVELNEPANLICSAELAERVKDQNIEVSITISNTLGSNFERYVYQSM